MLVAGGFCYGMLVDDGGSLVSRRIHRLLRVPPTGSSASGVVAVERCHSALGPEGRVSTSGRRPAKKPAEDRRPSVGAARCDVFREHRFAGCGMLVAGGFCYGMLVDNGGSLVSRRIHRLLRVPPTGSSASGAEGVRWSGKPRPDEGAPARVELQSIPAVRPRLEQSLHRIFTPALVNWADLVQTSCEFSQSRFPSGKSSVRRAFCRACDPA